jgi:predicted HTH domain antitoxin
MAKTISIELPDSLTRLYRSEKELTKEMKEALVLDLVRKHKITWRQGAQFLGMSYKEFLHFLYENKVPVFDYTPEELDEDLETLRKLKEKIK